MTRITALLSLSILMLAGPMCGGDTNVSAAETPPHPDGQAQIPAPLETISPPSSVASGQLRIDTGMSSGGFSETSTLLRDVSHAPLFALASGLASILGLLLALYATQVRTIPFSLYRSLMWRKALTLSGGMGLLVFGGMKFYAQPQAPSISPFREAHAMLNGVLRVAPWDYEPHGTLAWVLLFLLGGVLMFVGLQYDPAAGARKILIREQVLLQSALNRQIADVLRGRPIANLEAPDTEILADTLEYYRHVKWRFADVVLGPPPPAFPLFYRLHKSSVEHDEPQK